ncbi:Fatty acid hydroxylase [Moelleriella libera RCEF 2490]|uniref:Fatty acid hydroxylase n=1 Tax=Moelleriella libera RCEF 2490 TaxID=1081109 RepID=A0A162IFU6_9HYPO|nr:Fatty acid hydroxylase [Moelleriella libera RCEF 2490]
MSSTKPSPRDSIKSTWRTKDRSEWNVFHWFYEVFQLQPSDLDKPVPVHQKTDKVPFLNDWQQHRWILTHAFIPIALHHAYVVYTGRNLTAWQAVLLYTLFFKANAIREFNVLKQLGHEIGFLDGDVHERDGVPDMSVFRVLRSLVATSSVRPIFTIFLSYNASQTPSTINWPMLLIETGAYGIILDFWFYWYHRLMHEVPSLWQFHRTHHLTKHPNPLLSLYADHEQELFDIAGIPLMTYFSMKFMGFPMGFYEWWVCHQYIVFAELAGHSGLRMIATPANIFNWFLRMFNAELIIEDHDLHHRKGWKSSANYGKQTRLWDRIFGTCRERIECYEENIDWDNKLTMPLI